MAEGVFRCKQGFTIVQNSIVRNANLSLRAKGLYMLIQSYITMPDKIWTKSKFENMSTDGKKSFGNAWDELKAKGYLKVHIYPNKNK